MKCGVNIMKVFKKEIIPVLIVMLLLLSACSPASDSYDSETAIRNGDVVMQNTETAEVTALVEGFGAKLKSDLRKHPELIPYDGVLGGTMGFYDSKGIRVLSGRWVFAGFDDGHINGYMLLSYRLNDGKISWEVIDSYLDGE